MGLAGLAGIVDSATFLGRSSQKVRSDGDAVLRRVRINLDVGRI
jgi:hypothetical protein